MQLLSSRRWRAAAASAAMLGLVLTGCSADESFTYTPPAQVDAALPEATVTAMQGAVDNAIAASGASGAIVGVWVPWSGSWVAATGTQERDGGDELSTDMSFRIADVTRLMTCDVLYALADEGTVELDAKVPEYVSGVADMQEVTLLDLCNGTSGAASSETTAKSAWFNTPERVWAPLELASFGLGRDRVAPHTAFRDSDAGYLLLGLALERASGMSAAELIQEYVAEPLGLQDTSLPSPVAAPPSTGPVMKGHYLPTAEGGFNCAAPRDITTVSSSNGYTDSGVVSTITDLGRYAQAQAAQVLRTQDEPDRYGSPLPVSKKSASWFQATGGGYLVGSMVGQHGWTPGYITAAYADPATGFTVAVTLNDSTAGSNLARNLSWELAAIASKAPAASGQTAPEFGLPFTAEQYHQAITDSAITCVAPPAG
ncbi:MULTISPECIES: serine hydrolase [unclassified Microbacterium]|uniref:serine hydrolase domain-containing protein n=1 Tax=unclassified Microbacterium TaxID=2609290 RepID=UPI000EA891F3|nr:MULTISPECIES: serine hydrolase domain-containing protein [unclassified Microbacterium]MBT2483890.1 beta-lactamase family protein [Microbacterium sp. ISL-108]RKN66869.1 class A beta-lactamase-related serine hydrolase [Microbacterium sp. CGR2]